MARTRWPLDPENPGLLPRPGRSDRQRRWVPQKPGPGRQIDSQDSPSGVSRFGGQAGTQATDPTPPPDQSQGGRAGSTTHILPADYLWLSRSAEMFGIAPDLPALGSPPGDRRLVGSATHWWGELLGCWLGIRRLMTAQWHLVKGIYVPGSREAAGHLVDLAQAVCAAHLRAHWLGRWAAPAHAPSRAAP